MAPRVAQCMLQPPMLQLSMLLVAEGALHVVHHRSNAVAAHMRPHAPLETAAGPVGDGGHAGRKSPPCTPFRALPHHFSPCICLASRLRLKRRPQLIYSTRARRWAALYFVLIVCVPRKSALASELRGTAPQPQAWQSPLRSRSWSACRPLYRACLNVEWILRCTRLQGGRLRPHWRRPALCPGPSPSCARQGSLERKSNGGGCT